MLRYKAVFAEHGLRRTTFSCLSLIIDNPGLKQSQMAEALAIERPNLVLIVEDLTSAGLVSKEVSPTDRRAYALNATAKGKVLFERALADVQALDARMTEGMSEGRIGEAQAALAVIERNASKG